MENSYAGYVIQNLTEGTEDQSPDAKSDAKGRNLLGMLPMFLLILLVVLRISWTLYRSFGQKTRNPQPRRMYAGPHPRPSLGPQEPAIFVNPSNLPPPPKYECMAPPSYEEVVGVHYPQFGAQPISLPISAALAQGSAQGSAQVPAQFPAQGSTQVPAQDPATVTVLSEARRTSLAART